VSVPLVAAVAVTTMVLAASTVVACDSIVAKQRLDGAADSAALAAADAHGGWIEDEPCALAARVLASMGAELVECRIDDATGRVRLSAALRTMLGSARTHVQAGPPFT